MRTYFDRILFGVSFTIATVALTLGCYAPAMTALDFVKPTHMIFVSLIVYGILGSVCLVSTVMLLIKRKSTSKLVYLALLAVCVVFLGIYRSFLTGHKSDLLFLTKFSERINADVGSKTLNELFMKLRVDVEQGRQRSSPIDKKDLPQSIALLFKQNAPQGNLNFIGTNVYQMTISWGGPLFNWGIEVYQDIPREAVESGKFETLNLYTNAVVFMGK